MTKRSLGIFLGRTGAEATFVEHRRRGAYTVLAQVRADAKGPLWSGDYGGLRSLFRQLAKRLPGDARRADVSLQISLPDPLFSEDRLGFRELPDTLNEARELILWRVARELRKPVETLACAWQVEKIESDETRVLVRIIDRAILDAVTDAAGAAGFFASRIDGWSGFAMRQSNNAEVGAWVWANGDWWSLMCWSRQKPENPAECETLVHSEWRDEDVPAQSVAEKISRLVRTFKLSNGAARLTVYLDLPQPLAETVRASLDKVEPSLMLDDFPAGRTGGATCVALCMI
jgi:hypothetical protein